MSVNLNTVMLIDDNVIDLKIHSKLITIAKIFDEIINCQSGEEGLDYIKDNIRCNSVSPGRVHTPFVDGFLKKNYPGQEAEMFEKLSKTQPIGRMGLPIEVAHQVLYLCSEEAAFITGSDFSIDGGFITLNS